MNTVIEQLLALQNLQFVSGRTPPNREQNIAALRKQIPQAVMKQFDRWTARQRKAVAIVRHGACGECHLTLPIGTITAVAFGQELEHCSNCGRFLYLPEDEPLCSGPMSRQKTTDAGAKVAPRKTSDAHVAN